MSLICCFSVVFLSSSDIFYDVNGASFNLSRPCLFAFHFLLFIVFVFFVSLSLFYISFFASLCK